VVPVKLLLTKMDPEETGYECVEWIHLAQVESSGGFPHEQSNKPSGFVKSGNFNYLSD
jgi:hypothetical protein